jgi:hypothetical protein
VFACRGDHSDGNTNRVVTITGPAANAQTAHMLISQRLQVRAEKRKVVFTYLVLTLSVPWLPQIPTAPRRSHGGLRGGSSQPPVNGAPGDHA